MIQMHLIYITYNRHSHYLTRRRVGKKCRKELLKSVRYSELIETVPLLAVELTSFCCKPHYVMIVLHTRRYSQFHVGLYRCLHTELKTDVGK